MSALLNIQRSRRPRADRRRRSRRVFATPPPRVRHAAAARSPRRRRAFAPLLRVGFSFETALSSYLGAALMGQTLFSWLLMDWVAVLHSHAPQSVQPTELGLLALGDLLPADFGAGYVWHILLAALHCLLQHLLGVAFPSSFCTGRGGEQTPVSLRADPGQALDHNFGFGWWLEIC